MACISHTDLAAPQYAVIMHAWINVKGSERTPANPVFQDCLFRGRFIP